ncbi:hypothetical protein ACIHIX_09475 [Streptomyces sp. NPDC051913]|uniref:hypothetical protein n=1 Tax=Streptomyces sp. NPDC051913 TaxID=3365676 RepID=UPI0037D51A5E
MSKHTKNTTSDAKNVQATVVTTTRETSTGTETRTVVFEGAAVIVEGDNHGGIHQTFSR